MNPDTSYYKGSFLIQTPVQVQLRSSESNLECGFQSNVKRRETINEPAGETQNAP